MSDSSTIITVTTVTQIPPASKVFLTHKKVKSWLLNLNEKLLKLQPTILNDTELV